MGLSNPAAEDPRVQQLTASSEKLRHAKLDKKLNNLGREPHKCSFV